MQRLNLNNQYNDEPVVYCKQCLSLKIRTVADMCYCDKCGGVDMGEDHIRNWESLYENTYGKKFLEIKED